MTSYSKVSLIDSVHPVSILVIGAGGTGSHVLEALARLDVVLRMKDRQGLSISVIDDDVVTEANIGRSDFLPDEVGQNKAAILATRINQIYGIDVEAITERIKYDSYDQAVNFSHNIIITCVDNMKARQAVRIIIRKITTTYSSFTDFKYWIDTGNDKYTGQVIIGGEGLKLLDEFETFHQMKEVKANYGCSIDAALERQSLFINSTIAQFVGNTLYIMLVEGRLYNQGCYINLKENLVKPIKLKKWKQKKSKSY